MAVWAAKLLLRLPGLGHAIRWLAGVPTRTSEQRIAASVAHLLGEGLTPIAALAAAEAIEVGRVLTPEASYDRIDLDVAALRWYGVYEVRATGREIQVPLVRATMAMQAGVASTN